MFRRIERWVKELSHLNYFSTISSMATRKVFLLCQKMLYNLWRVYVQSFRALSQFEVSIRLYVLIYPHYLVLSIISGLLSWINDTRVNIYLVTLKQGSTDLVVAIQGSLQRSNVQGSYFPNGQISRQLVLLFLKINNVLVFSGNNGKMCGWNIRSNLKLW